jgi:hypothetical protein
VSERARKRSVGGLWAGKGEGGGPDGGRCERQGGAEEGGGGKEGLTASEAPTCIDGLFGI